MPPAIGGAVARAVGRSALRPAARGAASAVLAQPPPAIYCIGLNYKKHAAETNMPEPRHRRCLLRCPPP